MSQMALAVGIGGSEVAIRRMERGVQTPTVTTFILISRALNIAPASLLQAILEKMAHFESVEESTHS